MAKNHRVESMDYRTELLSPSMDMVSPDYVSTTSELPWQLNIDMFKLSRDQVDQDLSRYKSYNMLNLRKKRKIAAYYKRQENIIQGINELEPSEDLLNSSSASSTEDEAIRLARGERTAITASNVANFILLAAKMYASVETRSMAVIASTLDSLLDVLSGLILLFTSNAMKKPNPQRYPVGKTRMQPVGIVVFASIMAAFGLQIIFESVRQLITKAQPERNRDKEMWMIGIMVSVTVVKFILMIYCRRFKNEIVRAYAQDHLFDVVTNSVGLASAVLAIHFFWWIDPAGAIVIAVYTTTTWARTVLQNVHSLIGKGAPPEYLSKIIYMTWNHDEEIQKIESVRAYNFGQHYFVEVDIVLPGDMLLSEAHNIGENLQHKLELLSEVERAFVHVDYNFTHKPEHQLKV